MSNEELSNADVLALYTLYEAEISKIWLELSEAKPETTMRDAVIEWKRRQSNQTTSQIGAVMSAKNDTKAKLTELSKLLDEAKQKESQAVMKAGPFGNDLVDLYNKIKELIASIGLGDLGSEGIHALLHFGIDQLNKMAPTLNIWQRFVVLAIVKGLEAIDKQWHPDTPPV
jgi:hypothetical protein